MKARLVLILLLVAPVLGAPLFPDVDERHWAQDAVASLAAKGLVEGYPDGTFKGDRAASRWEVALIVARLLSRMESEHATFATQAEVDELRALAQGLRSELEALGVRVDSLEESTSALDKRVTELERITFYGSLDARFVGQTFTNDGAVDNDSGRGGAGLPSRVPFADYENGIGTTGPGLFRPQINGVLPAVDYIRGRLLSNGTSFTMRGVLGVNVQVTEELDAGLELVGFSSQGDRFVDGYWGLNAPYAAHPGSANPGVGGPQSLNHQPFTRMVLDKFWLKHEPSGTRLVLGTLDDLKIDDLVYMGQNNTTLEGPARQNFGFSVDGDISLGNGQELGWEVFHSRIGTRNIIRDSNYRHDVYGGDIRYSFHEKKGWLQLNFARIQDEAAQGGLLESGLLGFNNIAYGASTGWAPFQWVNPPGSFAAQTASELRAIPGWSETADNAIGIPAPQGGTYGPQTQQTYGVSGGYDWAFGEEDSVGFRVDYARSDYQSNRKSDFTSEGDAYGVALDGTFFSGGLHWGLDYLSVDPNYNPTRFRNGLVGARFPSQFQVAGAFQAHDFVNFPSNRRGIRAELDWSSDNDRAKVWGRGEWFEQTKTSLYDVRVTPGGFAPGTPNFAVIGFAPGFLDYIFSGYAHPNVYGAGSANSFRADLSPLEDVRGKMRHYALGGSYRFEKPDVTLRVDYETFQYDRPTTLGPLLGGSQNHVDINADTYRVSAAWQMNKAHRLSLGMDVIDVVGHHDPGGLYNGYAASIGSSTFQNIDSTQWVPNGSFDWQIDERTNWNLTVRRYNTDDHLSSAVFAGPSTASIGSSAHPFEWSGWQVTSTFGLKF